MGGMSKCELCKVVEGGCKRCENVNLRLLRTRGWVWVQGQMRVRGKIVPYRELIRSEKGVYKRRVNEY